MQQNCAVKWPRDEQHRILARGQRGRGKRRGHRTNSVDLRAGLFHPETWEGEIMKLFIIGAAVILAASCTGEVTPETAPESVEQVEDDGRFDVPSDPSHTYYLRDITGAHSTKYFVDVESHGPGGTLFTRRVIDCNYDPYGDPHNVRRSITIVEEETLEQFRRNLDAYSSKVAPIIEGSITDYIAKHACAQVRRK
jgi:hypothetical protein